MVRKDGKEDECSIRIDPVLVDKFRRLQGGINEVGTKIVRDLGLRYTYDKNRGTLDLIGPDTEILGLAVETLRFWVEDDEFPDTGISCQVGYPNRCIVIWRFHGDYAKKFDHLFAYDIAKLKLITSVNIKAVPTKRNPEYVELYCHFSVYQQVKGEVKRISKELSRIFQDDFFIPKSDFMKARDFARSKINDDKVLYALKEYPENKVRVWLFARNQMDVIRAKKEWVLHVGIIARENEFVETVKSDNSIKSASFFGHPASEIASEVSGPTLRTNESTNQEKQQPKSEQMTQTTLNLSNSRSKLKSKTSSTTKDTNPRVPRVDNSNFPRPPDFVYPVHKVPLEGSNINSASDNDEDEVHTNPFTANAELLDGIKEDGILDASNPMIGETKWLKEDETNLYSARNVSHPVQNRIYIHHQVDNSKFLNQQQPEDSNGPEQIGKLVVHPEKNLVENERYNPTHHSKSVLTSVTDPRQAPAIKRGNRGVRPGEKATKKTTTTNAATRQRRPVLKAKNPPPNIRYNINVNGLDIYMYKQDISKLTNMDALINVVAPSLKEGDKIATSLFAEAGKKIQHELDIHLRLHGEGKMGENIVTSAGRLPALGMVHVVSPMWQKYTVWEDCASDLHKALYETLKTAETHKYRRIGIPTIGSEPYFGIPKDLVAEVYVKALIDYSMGMGPMYPVLEIHLVDTDPSMLTYIKDAYESWASSPGVADMTHHITTERDHMINDPDEVSKRSKSAVSLKSQPTHRSENMVTFTGQSYTKEGEQIWTFDVLKKIAVHVYTGSVLKLDDTVEAIVCAVDINMKGTLAKQIQSLGGKRYRSSLKTARGNKSLVEGDVLITDAGDLGMRKVLHSVIATPIQHLNQRNLSRLDSINTQVFYVANQNGIKVLAMPLIGTGRLRERFEIEQCSLQLIDNIIELCLSLGSGMTLKDLHLVNTNHVMTQYLTQALRTRAHTKLRVETEPHALSRQDVLTKTETIRRTPERLSAKSRQSKGSSNKSLNLSASNDTHKNRQERKNESKENKDVNKPESNKETTTQPTNQLEENFDKTKRGKKKDLQRKSDNTNDDKDRVQHISNSKKNVPYLSHTNLVKHNRLIHDAWVHLMDDEMGGIRYEDSKGQKGSENREKPKRHQQLEPLEKDALIKKAQEFIENKKMEQTKKHRKKKQRIIQRSSDFVFQRPKVASYKKLYENKQKYAEYSHREEQFKLRKTQSSDDIWKKKLADDVFKTFQEEREKLARQKQLARERKEMSEKDTSVKETKKYYTRNTRDRYTEKANNEDVKERFERINRTDIHEGYDDNETGWYERKSETSRSENHRGVQKLKTYRRERHLIDTEREDQYMMDMDFLAKEYEERELEKNLKEDSATDTDGEDMHKHSYRKSDKSRKMQRDKFHALTSSEKFVKGSKKQHLVSSPQSRINHNHKVANIPHHENDNKPQVSGNSRIFPGNDTSFEREQIVNSSLSNESPNKSTNVTDKRSKNVDLDYKKPAKKSVKTVKTYPVEKTDHMNNSLLSRDKREEGRAQYIQSYNNKPKQEHEIPKLTKTIVWKNGMKVNKETLHLFNEQRRARRAPRPDEVTIKDKLKLHINVVDKETEDTEQIEKEKKKIKRFWEAVDGKEVRNEKEMFGDIDNKDKMLVAKLTKERKMSAKSKLSKQSKRSAVTHNVGDFNVTLEVAK